MFNLFFSFLEKVNKALLANLYDLTNFLFLVLFFILSRKYLISLVYFIIKITKFYHWIILMGKGAIIS